VKEKLQEYALVAEIIGGVAIVASLIFVGIQINQSNKLAVASAMDASNARTDSISRLAIEYDIPNINLKLRNNQELSGNERSRLRLFIETRLRHYETTYFQFLLDLVDEEQWDSNYDGLHSLVSSPAFNIVFPNWHEGDGTTQFGSSFVEIVNEIYE